MNALNIKYEDSEMILVVKPAGIATESRRIGEGDMVSMVRSYRVRKGEPSYIGMIHRLDQPVGGLLLFAKTKEAAARLSSQVQRGIMEKYYQTLLCGSIEEEGELTDYLVRDGKTNLSHVVKQETPGAKRASLKFWRRKVFFRSAYIAAVGNGAKGVGDAAGGASLELPVSLVEIKLETGRHHQIRVQMAHHGYPLLGDRKYNHLDISYPEGWEKDRRGPALFAWKLRFRHPKTGKWMEFTEEPGFDF